MATSCTSTSISPRPSAKATSPSSSTIRAATWKSAKSKSCPWPTERFAVAALAMNLRIAIRRAVVADLAAITEIYNEAILTTTATFDTEVTTVAQRMPWFEAHDERHPVLVAVAGEKVVGWSSLSKWSERRAYDDTAETSFYVRSEHRG